MMLVDLPYIGFNRTLLNPADANCWRCITSTFLATTFNAVVLIKNDATNPTTNVYWDNMQAAQRAMDPCIRFHRCHAPKSDHLPCTWHPPDSPRGSKRFVHGWLKSFELHPYSSKVGLPRELLPAGYIARIILCALSGNAEFATKVRGAEKQGLPKTGVRSQPGPGPAVPRWTWRWVRSSCYRTFCKPIPTHREYIVGCDPEATGCIVWAGLSVLSSEWNRILSRLCFFLWASSPNSTHPLSFIIIKVTKTPRSQACCRIL